MIRKIAIIALTYIGLFHAALAQSPTVYGLVTNEKEETLIGASVFWEDTKIGTTTDETGHFRIASRKTPGTLQIRYLGFEPAEVLVNPGEDSIWIEVKGILELKEVTVSAKNSGNYVSTIETRNVEHINAGELRKAPCCNLSESFTTNGTVDVTYPNAVTGVKEIQLLGLKGIYSQFTMENRPTLGGLATPFAFEYIPGTWLSSIQLAKGASTVKNGYGGMTGQINAELVKPATDKPLFFNLYTSTDARTEMNVHINRKGKGHFSNGLLLHGSIRDRQKDHNGDGFYDMPNTKLLAGMYRLFYESPKVCGQFNAFALTNKRVGGQIKPFEGVPGYFSATQNNDRIEVWGKMGYEGLMGKPYRQLGNMVSYSWHRTSAVFGPNLYNAQQHSFYWQTLYETIFGTTDHKIVYAPSLSYDRFEENLNETPLPRTETVPGFMAEYTYSRPDLGMEIPRFTLVLGNRIDHHNRYGWLMTPRASAKYNFTINTVLRASAGRGFRSANVIADNISAYAGNRRVEIPANLQLEEAWNYGLNFTHNFEKNSRHGSISVDVYRTDFVHQVLLDVESSSDKITVFNLNGASYANSVLGMVQYSFFTGFDLKVGYKWNDVRATYPDGTLRQIPLVAQHRGLVSADYETPNKKWLANAVVQFVGKQRMPLVKDTPHEYLHNFPEESPRYALLNMQLTRKWKKLEVYVGGENLTGFTQHHAIIAADQPESPYFNAANIYGPVMGATGFIGLRYTP